MHLLLALVAIKVRAALSDAAFSLVMGVIVLLLKQFNLEAASKLPRTWEAVRARLLPFSSKILAKRYYACPVCGLVFDDPTAAFCAEPSCCASLAGFEAGRAIGCRGGMLVFDIATQLHLLVRQPLVSQAMFDSRSLQPPLDGSVPDIRYSAQWRRLVAEMSDAERDELHFAGLTADGVQPYGKWSKKYSCWFFYLELLHLPPWVRRRPENTLLLAVSLGGAQPKNMQSLLGALVPMLNQAFTHGFAVFNGRLNSSVFFRFAIFRIYADGPALAKILHRYLHNARALSYI
jgi:hypothetical protein